MSLYAFMCVYVFTCVYVYVFFINFTTASPCCLEACSFKVCAWCPQPCKAQATTGHISRQPGAARAVHNFLQAEHGTPISVFGPKLRKFRNTTDSSSRFFVLLGTIRYVTVVLPVVLTVALTVVLAVVLTIGG